MATTIQLKRKLGTSSWNGTLAQGEPLFDVSSKKLYIGDGSHVLSELSPIGGDVNISSDDTGLLLSTTIDGRNDSLTIVNDNSIINSYLDNITAIDGDSIPPSTPSRLSISGKISGGKFMVDSGTHFGVVGDSVSQTLTIKGLNSSDVSYASLAINGQSSLSNFSGENVYIYGDGPQINLTLGHDDVTLANNNIMYTNMYNNCSIDADGDVTGASFDIDLSEYIITQITFSYTNVIGSAYKRDLFIMGLDSSQSEFLYQFSPSTSSYVQVTSSGNKVTLKTDMSSWFNVSNVIVAISYRAR